MKIRNSTLIPLFLFIAAGALALNSCSESTDESGGGGSGGGTSNVQLLLGSSNISALDADSMAATTCNVAIPGSNTPESGFCLTPLNVSGAISMLSIGSLSGTDGGARILGGGSELSGYATYFDYKAFDLDEQPSITGEDNLEGSSSTSYNYMSLQFAYLDVKFASVGKFWTVRQAYMAQPYSSTPSMQAAACTIEAGAVEEIDEYAELITGATFQKGDIMVCVKNTVDEACELSDFQWIDSDSATFDLAASRPANPATIWGASNLLEDDVCEGSGREGSFQVETAEINADITNAISGLSAEFQNGVKIYTYGGQTGNRLTATVDFDLTDALYFPIDPEAGGVTEADIRENLHKTMLQPILMKAGDSSGAEVGDFGLSTTLTLTIDDAPAPAE